MLALSPGPLSSPLVILAESSEEFWSTEDHTPLFLIHTGESVPNNVAIVRSTALAFMAQHECPLTRHQELRVVELLCAARPSLDPSRKQHARDAADEVVVVQRCFLRNAFDDATHSTL